MRMRYRFRVPPYQHQREALKFLLSTKRGGALLMDPRTGKTKVVVDYASILYYAGRVGKVLIFSPVNGLGVWKDEIEANCPYPHEVLIWDKKARKKNVPLPRGGTKKLQFVIVNYDALSTAGKVIKRTADGEIKRSRRKGGRYDVRKAVYAWQPDLVVLDESHRIKSPSAVKSRGVHRFHDIAPYRVIATGTVVTKKKRVFDVYSQWKFLNNTRFVDERGKPLNFGQFKSRYAIFRTRQLATGATFQQFQDNQNLDELHTLMHKDAYSVRRQDCFDLPPRTTQLIHFDLEESGPAYDQMAEDMVARIETGEITEASIKLVQSIRLRQLASGLARTMPTPEHPEGRLVVIGSEKLRMLEDRLEDLFEADEKVIIGASFTADIQRIEGLAKKLKVQSWTIRGGVKHDDRSRIRKAFERHSGPGLFVGHPAAAGEAIDLASASIMLWYSLPTSWVHFKQFQDRNALSQRPTFEEVLIAAPVDQVLWETLKDDESLARRMITSPERLLRERG